MKQKYLEHLQSRFGTLVKIYIIPVMSNEPPHSIFFFFLGEELPIMGHVGFTHIFYGSEPQRVVAGFVVSHGLF